MAEATQAELDAKAAAELEAAEAEETAEFEAGFTGTPTEVTPPADTDEAAKKAAADKVAADAAAAAAAAVVPPKYRQVTEDEWTALTAQAATIDQIKADHQKNLDKVFGTVGGLQRTLNDIQKATPAGYAVEVTDDTFADLKKEYPELSDMVLKGLKSFASKLKGTAPAVATLDPELIGKAVSDRFLSTQEEALEDAHPKWRELTGAKDSNTPYRQWLTKQPPEYQTRIASTNSADVISRSITKFESEASAAKVVADKAAADVAAKAAADKAAADKVAARRSRLEATTTQRGSGGSAAVETDDDFEAGFKSGPAGQPIVR